MRLLFLVWLSAMFCLICAQAHSEGRVIWECKTTNPMAEPIVYLVEQGSSSYVKFSSMRFAAHFQSEESQRGWYWNNADNGYYRYGLILGQDGKAWYHDFSRAVDQEPSEPLDYFLCALDD